MTDGDNPQPAGRAELVQCAQAIDAASTAGSQYAMAAALRASFGLGVIGEIPDTLPAIDYATLITYEYFVDTIDDQGRRRISLVPRHQFDDHSEPPSVRDVDETIIDVWLRLTPLVRAAAVRARLHHLLFQRGGQDTVVHANAAVDAYIESAADRTRLMDSVDGLAAATRLARSVKNAAKVDRSLELMADLATHQLDAEQPLFGVVWRALEHLAGEAGCPLRVDDLLEQAANVWSDANRQDSIFQLMLRRSVNDSQREVLWERRVQAHLDFAETESSPLMRSVRLQKALAVAEASNIKKLRDRAAGKLQAVRGVDQQMIRFSASSHRYEEEFDLLVEAVIEGDRWRPALIRFGLYGPIIGDPETNRRKIENDHRIAPLGRHFPVQLTTPEGLPFFTSSDEQTRFDVDLVTWEKQLIEQHMRVLTVALHRIPERHGLPTRESLETFLNSWPGTFGMGANVAEALVRYWAGDANGAAFKLIPSVETLARNLVLATDAGIYRLQKNQKPAQFPGLGVLLPLVSELYELSESRSRFLSAVLTHPAGMNLRNLMSHGYIGSVGPPVSALLIHVALGLATVSQPATEADVTPEHS